MKSDKNLNFIQFYKKYVGKKLPGVGLCNSLPIALLESEEFKRVKPTEKDQYNIRREWDSLTYWGSGLNILTSKSSERQRTFTPLRQTLVLLCACMRNEY